MPWASSPLHDGRPDQLPSSGVVLTTPVGFGESDRTV